MSKLEEIKDLVEDIYFADETDDPEELFLGLMESILEIIYDKPINEINRTKEI